MRLLFIREADRQQAARIVSYARDHEYLVAGDVLVPGADSRHVLHLAVGYRVVFSFTRHRGQLYRHLSISVSGDDTRFPGPAAVVEIATLFGFQRQPPLDAYGLPAGWSIALHQAEGAVVVLEPLPQAQEVVS
jgi:hypothetical protein